MSRLAPLEGLSVFLPAHNEEGNLERVVEGLRAELPKVARDYEIIVVNDGSRDRTGAIAEQIAAADPRVRAVHHPVNRGYGAAVVSGIAAATMPWVMLCDGDGQFDPADVAKLAARTDRYDVIAGRRARRADPMMRRFSGKAWTILMRALFGIRLSDVDCGFKLLRRDLIDVGALRARGAMISAELMARMAAGGARVCEVDVRHLPRRTGEQSGASLQVIMRAFGELFALYRELRAEVRRKMSKKN